MKVPHQVISLYWRTARKYRKLVSRIHRDGVSPYQRRTLLQRIRKLLRKLKALGLQLRMATAAGTLVLLLNQHPASAQGSPVPEQPPLPVSPLGPFVIQNRSNNPLREPIFNEAEPNLTVVDFDGDSDMDVVLGEYHYGGGVLRYFENQTSNGHPLYIEREGPDNPFGDVHGLTANAAPALADIDRDGDLDLFLGQNGFFIDPPYPSDYSRGIEYFRNDGGSFSMQTGTWDATTKTGNPLDNVQLGYNVTPVFVDFDKDGDLDLIAGSYLYGESPYYITKYVHYYQNDGAGNFTATDITLDSSPYYNFSNRISPALADLDGDGDLDMVIGNYNDGYLRYYKQDTPGNFIEQIEPWDPAAKTGNPFASFDLGRNISPAFLDFNGDGHIDLFAADELGWFGNKYSNHIINYYKNDGSGTFTQLEDFDNPFGGVFVKEDAAPVLIDIDQDGDLDAVIGNKYAGSYIDPNTGQYVTVGSYLTTYVQDNGVFRKVTPENDLFGGLSVDGNFAPQFADVDGDGLTDIITGNAAGDVVFFRNDGSTYHLETDASPFAGINKPDATSARLVDIDNDKDLDLFVSNTWQEVYYFKNNGNASAPLYDEKTGVDNPLNDLPIHLWGTAYLEFQDLDHDGDPDLLVNGTSPGNGEDQAQLFVENTGTPEGAVFDTYYATLFDDAVEDAKMFTIDYDGDGDLDAFAGKGNGTVSYLRNENPAVTITTNAGVVRYENGNPPVLLAEKLTLADSDGDLILQAVVTINNYLPGEKLVFTPHDAIAGVFDTSIGVLTLRGKADLAAYQSVLRSITFEASYQSGRRTPGDNTVIGKSISYTVFDQDYTNPVGQDLSIEIFVNDPPSIADHTVNVSVGQSATVDLKQIASDANGSSDLDLASFRVVEALSSGASATVDANGMLTLDYSDLTFVGDEPVLIEVCDRAGSCAQNVMTVRVSNSPPVIAPAPVATTSGSIQSINLMTITSDVDGNLDPQSFTIVGAPLSNAVATIEVVSDSEVNLHLNYEGVTYRGTDEITIRACDHAGACSESIVALQVDVDGDIIVYNAVAPNSSGNNRIMRIVGLPENNKVTIYNRWGDKVFEAEQYVSDPSGNAFRGLNDNGAALPSGTYFYTIEIPEEKMISGYLTLKQ